MTHSSPDLSALYQDPSPRALGKQLDRLDVHAERFVRLSPFVVLASASSGGHQDCSPRGGSPGFVQVRDPKTLWLPDARGNNRLDTLNNLQATGRIGLLFLLPGVDETLRVNGAARLRNDPEVLTAFRSESHPPKVVVEIQVEEVFLHCAKALMRSRLWSDEARVDRSVLPSMGQMIGEQMGSEGPFESTEDMRERYRPDL